MKISMLMTSLVVAMSAMSLTACETPDQVQQKANDTMEKSNEMLEKPAELKDEMVKDVQPTPAPPSEPK